MEHDDELLHRATVRVEWSAAATAAAGAQCGGGCDSDACASGYVSLARATTYARTISASSGVSTGAKLTIPFCVREPSSTTLRQVSAEASIGDQRRSGKTPAPTAESPWHTLQ